MSPPEADARPDAAAVQRQMILSAVADFANEDLHDKILLRGRYKGMPPPGNFSYSLLEMWVHLFDDARVQEFIGSPPESDERLSRQLSRLVALIKTFDEKARRRYGIDPFLIVGDHRCMAMSEWRAVVECAKRICRNIHVEVL